MTKDEIIKEVRAMRAEIEQMRAVAGYHPAFIHRFARLLRRIRWYERLYQFDSLAPDPDMSSTAS